MTEDTDGLVGETLLSFNGVYTDVGICLTLGKEVAPSEERSASRSLTVVQEVNSSDVKALFTRSRIRDSSSNIV